MTQNDAIYHYLRKGNTLTPLEALRKFGTLRLAARIADLRDSGVPVESEMIVVYSLTGPKRVACYRMVGSALIAHG